MSFGISNITDLFSSLIKLTIQTCQDWKSACGEHTNITQELDNLRIVLCRVSLEVKKPTSFLLDDHDLEQLRAVAKNCQDVVSQLRDVVSKYEGKSTSRRNNWDRIRLKQKNLGSLRDKLAQQIANLGAYLSLLGDSSLEWIAPDIEEIKPRLDAAPKRNLAPNPKADITERTSKISHVVPLKLQQRKREVEKKVEQQGKQEEGRFEDS